MAKRGLADLIALPCYIAPGIQPRLHPGADMGEHLVGKHSGSRTAAGPKPQIQPVIRRHKQHQKIGDEKDQGASQILGEHQHQNMAAAAAVVITTVLKSVDR